MRLDKVTHFLAGASLALSLGYLLPVVFGLLAAIAAGALKEIYDEFHPETHTVDVMDFLATVAGGIVASIFVLLIT